MEWHEQTPASLDERSDEPKTAPRMTPENKEEDLRTALHQALMSDPPQKVLVIGTMKNKKSCPQPPGLEFMDEKSLSTSKTLPSAMSVLVFLTSINHKSWWKMGDAPEGVTVFSQVSGNQLRRVLKGLGYTQEAPPASEPPAPSSPVPPAPVCQPKKLQQFGEKRIRAVINANQICNDLAINQAVEFILDCINKLGGKANPKTVLDVIERLRASTDTNSMLKAIDADQELEQLFKELDRIVAKIKRRFREVVEERNGFEHQLYRTE